MTTRYFLLLLFSCLYFPCQCFAQDAPSLAPEVAANFPAAVIIRVYQAAARMRLPADRQLLLARHFTREDSLVAAALVSGAPPEKVAALRLRCDYELTKLFTSRERSDYNNKVIFEQAHLEATLTAERQARKYGLNVSKQAALDMHYSSREQQLYRTFQRYAGTPQLSEQVAAVIAEYDTAETKMLQAVRAGQYYLDRKAVLDSIRPLPEKDGDLLYRWYNTFVYTGREKSFADAFAEAMRRSVKDTLYYAVLYGEEIAYQAKYDAGKTLYDLGRKTQLTVDATPTLRALVEARERSIALIQYAMPVFSRYKDSVYTRAVRHHDSLIGIALMKDGYFPHASQSSLAIKNRRQLALRPGQVDTLYAKAQELQQMRKEFETAKPSGRFDPAPFEAQRLQPLLSEEQYLQLLTLARPQAELTARNDFAELVQRKLSEPADSVAVMAQLTAYFANREVVRQRYVNDKVQQYKHLLAMEQHAPMVLRRLREARVAEMEAVNKSNPGLRASFQW